MNEPIGCTREEAGETFFFNATLLPDIEAVIAFCDSWSVKYFSIYYRYNSIVIRVNSLIVPKAFGATTKVSLWVIVIYSYSDYVLYVVFKRQRDLISKVYSKWNLLKFKLFNSDFANLLSEAWLLSLKQKAGGTSV